MGNSTQTVQSQEADLQITSVFLNHSTKIKAKKGRQQLIVLKAVHLNHQGLKSKKRQGRARPRMVEECLVETNLLIITTYLLIIKDFIL